MTQDIARTVVASRLVRNPSLELSRETIDAVAWDRRSILFSACNEDSASELRAFGAVEGKRIVCVTAGGGRVLNLLSERPKEIWAVDLNPAQNALLELKIAGMRALDHEGYLGFLGVRPSTARVATYESLRHHLTPGAQKLFDSDLSVIERGALLQGKLERFFGRLATVLRFVRPLGIERLFALDDLSAQKKVMERWHTPLWRTIGQAACRRSVLAAFSGDPGFYRYVPAEVALHEAIYDSIHGYLSNHLARENPLLQLVFFGKYIYEPALPIYLNAATFGKVKSALAGVHVETVTATVDDVLEHAGAASFDVFSLSDISSYLDPKAHDSLFENVIRAARPGARMCSRSNIHHRPLTPEHARRVERDRALEARLGVDDHACVHKFVVGEIIV